jgi:hypothetical protein
MNLARTTGVVIGFLAVLTYGHVISALPLSCAGVPTDGLREAYRTDIVAKQRRNSGSLTKTIDRLEWMREQMLTLQRALERVELDKRGRQIPRATTRLKIKQF